MPTRVLDLGAASLHSRESNISIELKSSANFASSAEDVIDQLRQQLTAARVTDQSNGKPWIHRGNNFKLVILLHLGGSLDLHDQDEVVEVISEKIQVAKMWQQLRLVPSSVQSSVDEAEGGYAITTHLTYDDSAPSAKRQLHKLGADVPFHDVRPPDEVAKVSCEAVRISLALEQRRHRKRKRDHAFDRLDHDVCLEHQDVAGQSHEEMLDEHGRFFCHDEIVADEHALLFLSETEDCILDAQSELEADELDVFLDDELRQAASSAIDDFALEPPEPVLCGPCPTSSDVVTTVEGCVRAIEAALQLAICGASIQSRSDFSVHLNGSLCSLADAIPSLCSPNYLPSVASRALFIPTVAHALQSVLQRTVDKVETDTLVATDAVEWLPRELRSQGKRTQGSLLSSQLWKRMQDLLYNNDATRQLSLLCESAEDRSGERGILDELLDGDEAYLDDAQMLKIEERCDPVEDDWGGLVEDEIGDYLGNDEGLVASNSGGEALADDLEDDPLLDGICSSPIYQVYDHDDGYYSTTPDDLPGQAKTIATSTRQGGESMLKSPASQASIMPSQSRESIDDSMSCKITKQPAAILESRGTLWLPDEAGRHFSMREDLLPTNSGGNEMLLTEADLQYIPSDGCEMLCI